MTELEKVIALKRAYRKPMPKKMVKRGTITRETVEATPLVWKGRLIRFGWKRIHHRNEEGVCIAVTGCYHFVDMETNEEISAFADGHSFGSAYTENDKMYVIGTEGGFGSGKLVLFISEDLKTWERHIIFEDSVWMIYNTSFCKGVDGYVLAVEISHPIEIAGENPYTIVFMKSKDLIHWEFYDLEKYVYVKDRYAACPVLRFVGGYYYMIYLESFPAYNSLPYITRSKDLLDWEIAPLNPIMFYDENDRIVAHPERFTKEELEDIQLSLDTNNSDVDLCEFQGKTILLYSWGNQLGHEFLAWAEYDGSMQEFFESFY